MGKILEGLLEALVYSRCRHEHTVWEPVTMMGCSKPNMWRRICTKCKTRETVFHDPERDPSH